MVDLVILVKQRNHPPLIDYRELLFEQMLLRVGDANRLVRDDIAYLHD